MAACSSSTCSSELYLITPSGWPAIGSCVTSMGRRLSEFPQIKAFLGKGYLSKPVSGIVMGMSAGDVTKCIVRWKSASATSDRYVDLPMPKRKLNNLFSEVESGSASKKAHVDDNSAGLSSVPVVESCSSSSDDDEDADEDSA